MQRIEKDVFYTASELEAMGVAKLDTIRGWVRKGELKANTIGKKYAFLGQDVIDFITKPKPQSELALATRRANMQKAIAKRQENIAKKKNEQNQ